MVYGTYWLEGMVWDRAEHSDGAMTLVIPLFAACRRQGRRGYRDGFEHDMSLLIEA